MIERLLTSKILRDLSWSPIIGLVGSRQVGKTTLAKRIMPMLNKPSLYFSIFGSDYGEVFRTDVLRQWIHCWTRQHSPQCLRHLRCRECSH